MYVISCQVVSDSVRPYGLLPARLLYQWDSPGKNTGGGYHAVLQGIFLTQGSKCVSYVTDSYFTADSHALEPCQN